MTQPDVEGFFITPQDTHADGSAVRLDEHPPALCTLSQALVRVHGRAKCQLTLADYQLCIEPLVGYVPCSSIRMGLERLGLLVDASLRVRVHR